MDKETSKGYPSVQEMQNRYPEYPCGRREGCRYKDRIDLADKCSNLNGNGRSDEMTSEVIL